MSGSDVRTCSTSGERLRAAAADAVSADVVGRGQMERCNTYAPLFRVESAEYGMAAEVHTARAGCFSVSLVDTDAGERVQCFWFFSTLEAAQDKAQRMMV